MHKREDFLTARRVDMIIALLPIISWLEAACALAALDVPLDVAARVLALPKQRRAVTLPAFPA